MQPDQSTLLSRQRGTLPDKFWYQLNGRSAQENYIDQKDRMFADLTEEADELHIISEVKLKWVRRTDAKRKRNPFLKRRYLHWYRRVCVLLWMRHLMTSSKNGSNNAAAATSKSQNPRVGDSWSGCRRLFHFLFWKFAKCVFCGVKLILQKKIVIIFVERRWKRVQNV